MFGKRGRELGKKSVEYRQRLTSFEQQIQAGLQEKDPAVQILAFKSLLQEMAAYRDENKHAFERAAKSTETKTLVTGTGLAGVAGAATIVLVSGPVGWVGAPVILGGALLSGVIGSHRKKSALRAAEEAVGGFIKLEEDIKILSSYIDQIMEKDAPAISRSPQYQTLMADADLSAKFMQVATRRLVTESQTPASTEPVSKDPIGDKLRARGDEQEERFAHFIKLGQQVISPPRKPPTP